MINYLKKLFSAGDGGTAEGKSREDEKNFDLLKYDGIRAMRMGKTDYAEKCFARALEIRADAETLRCLASLYAGTGRGGEAVEVLTRLVEVEPDAADAMVTMAGLLYAADDYDGARRQAQAALAVDEGNAEALLALGKADWKLGNELEAIADLTRAIGARDGYAEAVLTRAEVLAAMRQPTEALADIETALGIDGENEQALMLKGRLLAMTGDVAGALAAWDALVAVNPFNFDAYVAKAGLLTDQGKAAEAVAVIDEALELSSAIPQLYKARGRARLALGDKDGAAEDVRKALELRPEDAASIDGKFSNKPMEFDNIVGIFK